MNLKYAIAIEFGVNNLKKSLLLTILSAFFSSYWIETTSIPKAFKISGKFARPISFMAALKFLAIDTTITRHFASPKSAYFRRHE